MVRFDFFLPEEMLEELKRKEVDTGNSVSSVIRTYIKKGLDEEKNNGGRPSVPNDKR